MATFCRVLVRSGGFLWFTVFPPALACGLFLWAGVVWHLKGR